MTEYRNEHEVERALATVPRHTPRAEFLRELETQFTQVHSLRALPVRTSPRPRVSSWAMAAGIAAIAASALAIYGWRSSRSMPHSMHWTPVAGHLPHSTVTVDGRAVPPDELDAAVASETMSHTVVTGTDSVWFQLGEHMVCEMGPGSEVEFGPLSEDGAPFVIAARKGSLRVCTGESFVGSKLDVKTPDFDLEIVGTSFAIDIDDEGTCVCCLEGRVVMKAPKAFDETWAVDSGRMCRIYHDERAPKWDGLSEKHGPALTSFDEEAEDLIE